MANMSYCRFRNTLKDLQDCFYALDEMTNNGGVDEYGEKLSFEERRAASCMYDLCRDFIDIYEEFEEIEERNKQD